MANVVTILIGSLMIFLSLFTFMAITIYIEGSEKKIERVPCYDRYGNEIIDLTCEKEIITDPVANFINSSLIWFGILMLVTFLLIFGAMNLLFGILEESS